jgi:Flp pilus assembly protein TadG
VASVAGVCAHIGAALRRRHRLLRATPDRGYTVLEAAITLPTIFFLLMFIVQWAIVWHSRNVAQAAAQEALRTAEQYHSSATAGQSDGDNFLGQVAPHALGSNCLTVIRSATTVTVHAHCPIMSVIPFAQFWADETVSAPIEHYVITP